MRITQTPEDLLATAKLGGKLNTRDRLSVAVWLERTGDIKNYSTGQLQTLLKCSPTRLQALQLEARRVVASAISPDEAMNYMAEFLRHQDLLILHATNGVKTAPVNTGVHQGYMRLLKEVSAEKIDKLQSIGIIPKELGRLTAVTEEWTAVVSDDGVASVRETSHEGTSGYTH